jgi:hypothetical protein
MCDKMWGGRMRGSVCGTTQHMQVVEGHGELACAERHSRILGPRPELPARRDEEYESRELAEGNGDVRQVAFKCYLHLISKCYNLSFEEDRHRVQGRGECGCCRETIRPG